jgi:geranyl-CoA carboxylase alpha subunit
MTNPSVPLRATPFQKILIANRGEIALRVMRSAKELGYRTVAVYSTADSNARHVFEADQAICIGEPEAARSYLNITALIEAAHASGADAVHPGYGFLAENEQFAQACERAGLVFIGPSANAIEAMGNKAEAKRLMEQANIPCIPGYLGDDQSDERLISEAGRIGYPVMIKAAAGGGGRGMRYAASAGDFIALLHSARSEALSAFGSSEIILERALIEPRHIEIQILADRYGNVIHLGERDCSIQRRHQKVIEETPSPAVTPELRTRMGQAAITAAKLIGYEGAGTIEFLLSSEGLFYFMEMNTRLQVEHPVTEAVTGLDLVQLQLRIAAGQPLELAQTDVHWSGHAIEARLCAEDMNANFMPQSGVFGLWQIPKYLRVDHALQSNADVPMFYDSMVAKLIAHGTTREEAIRKLITGLEDTVALGVRTNQHFLQRCLAHPVFAAGAATTAFIEQYLEKLLSVKSDEQARAAAVVAVALQELRDTSGIASADSMSELALRFVMNSRFDLNGQRCQVELVRKRAASGSCQYQISVTLLPATASAPTHTTKPKEIGKSDVETHSFSITPVRQNGSENSSEIRLICNGVLERAHYWSEKYDGRKGREGAVLWLHYLGQAWQAQDMTLAQGHRQALTGSDGKLRALMNGRVVAVLTQPGQPVRVGDPVFTIEAMKMEHIHSAPVAGTLTVLHAQVGQQVAARQVIAEIEPPKV